jgi:excinuclease ABC subunit B
VSLFSLKSNFSLTGDQPSAVSSLLSGLEKGEDRLVLQGVTGSGKTFTMANLIQRWSRPTLVLSHNKTLAAQLFAELKEFFPENAVEYFVSYYDYYQPEAYIPQTDTYIEKDAAINEEIERYRLAATNALIARRDVIVVSSVSCIYGLGESDEYRDLAVRIAVGDMKKGGRSALAARLVESQYARNDFDFKPGYFRMRGDVLDIFPAYETKAVRVDFFGDEVDSIHELDPLTGRLGVSMPAVVITPAKQFVMSRGRFEAAFKRIEDELEERLAFFEKSGKLLEAQRLRERTEYDIEMMRELGYCNGIENYSRPLSGRPPDSAPECLIDYFPDDFLTIIDESHATVPQIRAMFNGDRARKTKLVDFGFRLPSAKDNRPLTFDEFNSKVKQIVYCSATPADYELSQSKTVAKQVIRPTGLLDPEVEIRPLAGQIDDLMVELSSLGKDRALVTTLTKRSAEDLARYLHEAGVRVEYLHSDVDAIERVGILQRLRKGDFDVLVGINLLREGLDLPEVALVAVLDADKEGFLRSSTSLLQTAGRAARHEKGRVILYADRQTDAIREFLAITSDHRARQIAYNKEHSITPRSVKRPVNEAEYLFKSSKSEVPAARKSESVSTKELVAELTKEMLEAADELDFERAAYLRDQIKEIKKEAEEQKVVSARRAFRTEAEVASRR